MISQKMQEFLGKIATEIKESHSQECTNFANKYFLQINATFGSLDNNNISLYENIKTKYLTKLQSQQNYKTVSTSSSNYSSILDAEYYPVIRKLFNEINNDHKAESFCKSLTKYNLIKAFPPLEMHDIKSVTMLYIKSLFDLACNFLINTISTFFGYKTQDLVSFEILSAEIRDAAALELANVTYKDIDNFATKMKLASTAPAAQEYKINTTMNYIWFTNPKLQREISDDNIINIINNKMLFEQVLGKEVSVQVYTNNKKLIPQSATMLAIYGIETKDIDSQFKSFDLVTKLIAENKLGMASDTFRQEVDGCYLDVNYKILQIKKEYFYKYDFFAEDYQNNFFCANRDHPIKVSALNIIQENFKNPPEGIENLSILNTGIMTYNPHVTSIVLHSNEPEFTDYLTCFPYNYDSSLGERIGQDNFAGEGRTWKITEF